MFLFLGALNHVLMGNNIQRLYRFRKLAFITFCVFSYDIFCYKTKGLLTAYSFRGWMVSFHTMSSLIVLFHSFSFIQKKKNWITFHSLILTPAQQDWIPSPFSWNRSPSWSWLEPSPEFLKPVSESVGTGFRSRCPVRNFFLFYFISFYLNFWLMVVTLWEN